MNNFSRWALERSNKCEEIRKEPKCNKEDNMNWLSGKKTYIVAICTIIYGVGLILNGQTDQGVQVILGGLGLGGLRAGVAKSG